MSDFRTFPSIPKEPSIRQSVPAPLLPGPWHRAVCSLSGYFWSGTVHNCFSCISNPQHKVLWFSLLQVENRSTERLSKGPKVTQWIDLRSEKRREHSRAQFWIASLVQAKCPVTSRHSLHGLRVDSSRSSFSIFQNTALASEKNTSAAVPWEGLASRPHRSWSPLPSPPLRPPPHTRTPPRSLSKS